MRSNEGSNGVGASGRATYRTDGVNLTYLIPGTLPMLLVANWWAGWLSRRRSNVPAFTRHVPAVLTSIVALSMIGTGWALWAAYRGVSGAPAGEKQAQLADGITMAFYSTFIGWGSAALTLVLLLVITVRSKRLQPVARVTGSAPPADS